MSAVEVIAGHLGAPYGNRMTGDMIARSLQTGAFVDPDRPEWGSLFLEIDARLLMRALNEVDAPIENLQRLYREHLSHGGATHPEMEALFKRWGSAIKQENEL